MKFARKLLPRFRLRTLLVLLGIVAVGLAIYGGIWRQRENQYEVALRLGRKGVRVFSYEKGSWFLRPPIQYLEIDEYLGVRYGPGTWEAVRRPERDKLTVEEMASLAHLPDLRKVHLQGDVLAPGAFDELAKLAGLRSLVISHYPLDDEMLSRLSALKTLQELTLEATQTTDGGIDNLREQLPELEVYDD